MGVGSVLHALPHACAMSCRWQVANTHTCMRLIVLKIMFMMTFIGSGICMWWVIVPGIFDGGGSYLARLCFNSSRTSFSFASIPLNLESAPNLKSKSTWEETEETRCLSEASFRLTAMQFMSR